MEDEQEFRIEAILGNLEEVDVDEGIPRYFEHLKQHLKLPCEVTASADFEWEEYYVDGPGDEAEYAQLKRAQPTFVDLFDLLAIDLGTGSRWMLFRDEDIAALCRRRPDGREFVLGLAELEATDMASPNYQLLSDYSYWVVNCR